MLQLNPLLAATGEPEPIAAFEPASPVPLCRPDLSERERAYAAQALASNEIGPSGPFRDRFETAWAERNGVARALTFSSGTTALHAALLALGIGPGDEVIVPALSYVASANAVLHAGARPVFVDVDPETFCLAPDAALSAVTARTRALMPVHLFGHPCPMDPLRDIADAHGLALVADAAHAPLAGYRGRPLASGATLTVHSFHLNKTFTAGEGGALLADDPDLITAALRIRSHGLDLNGDPTFHGLGYNYRLSNLACAILCAQEERAEGFLMRCARLDRICRHALCGIDGLGLQAVRDWAQPVHWHLPVVLPPGVLGEGVIERLAARGIGARPFFPTPDRIAHLAPFHRERPHPIPNARLLAERGLMLPLRPSMTDDDAGRVAEELIAALA